MQWQDDFLFFCDNCKIHLEYSTAVAFRNVYLRLTRSPVKNKRDEFNKMLEIKLKNLTVNEIENI